MFGAAGKKKVLVMIKRALDVGAPMPDVEKLMSPNRPEPVKREPKREVVLSQVSNMKNLETLLASDGLVGEAMEKVLEATCRYNPAKDAHVLKAFQSSNIDYKVFRHHLHSIFWIKFTDPEYLTFTELYDPGHIGVVNGYDFMTSFIMLNSIRKDKESRITREKNEAYIEQVKAEEERKLIEAELKLEEAVDYDFNEDDRAIALKKLGVAAKKFDPNHPGSPELTAFECSALSVGEFRGVLKRTFNLRLSGKELGALVKEFGDPDGSGKKVPCAEFLQKFFKMGFTARAKEQSESRLKQAQMDKLAEEEEQKKFLESNKSKLLQADYDYSEADQARAYEKMRVQSIKYDRSAVGAPTLEGFDCQDLSPGEFRELVRRTFGLVLTLKELGVVAKKYDINSSGRVNCAAFLTKFLRTGVEERHKIFIESLAKQRRMNERAKVESEKKIKEIQEGGAMSFTKIDFKFTDEEMASALKKLTEASVKHDTEKHKTLPSFEVAHLSPIEFKRALEGTFNIKLTPGELGAAVCMYDKDGTGKINCHQFLINFLTLGFGERNKFRLDQLKKNREGEEEIQRTNKKKKDDLINKSDIKIDFMFEESDRESAMSKLTAAATKYDKTAPGAMALDGFNCKSMTAAAFKEIVRRTFNLKLTPKETGAIVKHFDKSNGASLDVDCSDFVTVFLQLGISERAKFHLQQMEKQREDNRLRQIEEQKAIDKLCNRSDFRLEGYSEADAVSIMEKVGNAAEGYDKNHPAAYSLDAFECESMAPGLFREIIRTTFRINASPGEVAYLLKVFDTKGNEQINCNEFITKFLLIGKKRRDEKHKVFLEKVRNDKKLAVEAEEKILAEQLDRYEKNGVDFDFTRNDLDSAIDKMRAQAGGFDKSHPSAPSLVGFERGPLKPGEFRELLKGCFRVYLTPKEVGAVVTMYAPYIDSDRQADPTLKRVDPKQFMIKFTKLGVEERAKAKARMLELQKKAEEERQLEAARRKKIAEQKLVLDVDNSFGSEDLKTAMLKIRQSAAKYDKNAPGCPALTAFDAAFLTPVFFREVVRRTFNIVFTPKELSAVIDKFDNGDGNVGCQEFLVDFIKFGNEERSKAKKLQLEKDRVAAKQRKAEDDRKIRENLEKGADLVLNTNYSVVDRDSAFEKLTIAAKKYDRSLPGSLSLDKFAVKHMTPGDLRESVRCTFNVLFTVDELSAIMAFFDEDATGFVECKQFINHFIKTGVAERAKEHMEMVHKLRKDAHDRQREHEDAIAAQWRKSELKVVDNFSDSDKESAMEKLQYAAECYDPQVQEVVAFEAKTLKPVIFREMLKRTFGMKLSDREFAAIVSEFDPEGNKEIVCQDFLIRFTNIGIERRRAMLVKQIQRNKELEIAYRKELEEKKKAADEKVDARVDFNFDKEDFNSALQKIREVASSYDRSHPSAPSLSGFTNGGDMRPFEFRDMMARTFHVTFTDKELGAVVNFFDQDGNKRVSTQEFLAHFFKLQRSEQEKRRKEQILERREVKNVQKVEEIQKEKMKLTESIQRLQFNKDDEMSFLSKFRQACQAYAIDSTSYNERLQAFKGPAMYALAFRDIFRRMFMITLSYPEIGVMIDVLKFDNSGMSIDGKVFLNWFYKIARFEEMILLKEIDDCITMDFLRNPTNPKLDPLIRAEEEKKKRASGKIVSASDLEKKYSGRSKFNVNKHSEDEIGSVKANRASSSSPGKERGKSVKLPASTPMQDFFDENGEYINGEEFAKKIATKRTVMNEKWVLPSLAPDENSFFDYHSDKQDVLDVIKARNDRYRDPEEEEAMREEKTNELNKDADQFLKSKKILSKTLPAPLKKSKMKKGEEAEDLDLTSTSKNRSLSSPPSSLKKRDISSAPDVPKITTRNSSSLMVLPQQMALDSAVKANSSNSTVSSNSMSYLGQNQEKTIDDIINSIEVDSIAARKLKEIHEDAKKKNKNSFKISAIKGFHKEKKPVEEEKKEDKDLLSKPSTVDMSRLIATNNNNTTTTIANNNSNSASTAPNPIDLSVSDGFTIPQPGKKEKKEKKEKQHGGSTITGGQAVTVGSASKGGFFFPVLMGSKPIDTSQVDSGVINSNSRKNNNLNSTGGVGGVGGGGVANNIAFVGLVSMDKDDRSLLAS